MCPLIKTVLSRLGLFRWRQHWKDRRKISSRIRQWEAAGRPVPPPHLVKQQIVRTYAARYRLRTLIESGTYLGDMVDAMKDHFDSIVSIELSATLYEKARLRFKGDPGVELILGDSGSAMAAIVSRLTTPALFWLDGHYSGDITARGKDDTPILEELAHILNAPRRGHVILIDDARCFGSDPAYPTLENLSTYIRSRYPEARIEVGDDIIRVS